MIVTGLKGFDNYPLLKQKLDFFLKDKLPNVVIVSGEAEGVKRLAEKNAVERHLDICSFPIDWEKYGRQAAVIRNNSMFDRSDSCLIFWDGKSQDTGYIVGMAKKKGLDFKVIRY
ncbi:DUF2493 domain-containing protein [Neobacillus niacini]|uniref:DUF2493 domain-containing protein n=1 Tax=Neobacillus niacini TaxID=86668 RepID=UPI0021CB4921|nr:DUF2493 domain-containing protein [Neobacillus niacini]MCM3764608.1 DUF2493 domain-containing protein [Neobacillus niacini]